MIIKAFALIYCLLLSSFGEEINGDSNNAYYVQAYLDTSLAYYGYCESEPDSILACYRSILLNHLTQEERDFLESSPVIPIVARYNMFPYSFFSDNEWQGISFDIINSVAAITGLNFRVVNGNRAELHLLLDMMESGEASMISQAVFSETVKERFLAPQTMFSTKRTMLISKTSFPYVRTYEIYNVRVGMVRDEAHTDFFTELFPDHQKTIMYSGKTAAIKALQDDEIDVLLGSHNTLMYLLNHRGFSDYKANIVFGNTFGSSFAFAQNQEMLKSVFDKTMPFIDVATIVEQWRYRINNSRFQELRELFFRLLAFALLIIAGVTFAFYRSRKNAQMLEKTIKKRTQELLLQSSTMSALFNSIPSLVYTKNIELEFTRCNRAFLKNFGIKYQDVDKVNNLLPQAAISQFNLIDAEAVQKKRSFIREQEISCYDGKSKIYETVVAPILSDNETVIGVIVVAHDITERKKMETASKSSYIHAQKLTAALSNITKSTEITQGTLSDIGELISREGCYVLGVDRVSIWKLSKDSTQFEGIKIYDAASQTHSVPDNFRFDIRSKYLEKIFSDRLITLSNHNECKEMFVDFSDYGEVCAVLEAPIRVEGAVVGTICIEQLYVKGKCENRDWLIDEQNFASSLADIMALAITNYERRKNHEAAEVASKAKSTFLANMSHEIRTPMNAILGITEILMQKDCVVKGCEEALEKIYNSSCLLLGIINDILDFSKIEAGKMEIRPANYMLASLINDTAHLNMMRIGDKNIDFVLEINPQLPANLIGDELRIKQILNNILSNAFKYTDSGQVTFSVDFSAAENERETVIIFKVQDTGYGMTKEQLDRLFEEYTRFDNEMKVEGTGLGLAITHNLMKLMNAEISVESEPKKGSVFTVSLPQKKVDEEVFGKEIAENLTKFGFSDSKSGRKKSSRILRDPMPYGKVLVVDDVETNHYVANGLMALYALNVDNAMSGKEAIRKVQEGNFYDIIFIDHMMPEMDGMETTEILREQGYTGTIVALTANAVAGQADIFLQNGFDEFISKPIDVRQLNMVLNKFVRDKQPPEVIEAARLSAKSGASSGVNEQVNALLIKSFLRDADKAAATLEETCPKSANDRDEEKLRKFTITVHGMKSALWNVGEKELSDVASELETSGRNGNVGDIADLAPSFLNGLRKIMEKYKQSQGEASGGEEDIDALRGKLAKIAEACEDYDRKAAQDIISQVKNAFGKTKEVLENINELILHSDFEEAQAAAQEYSDSLAKQ